MPLPTRKSAPTSNLSDMTALIYGPPKVGKSTFCSELPDALFLATEPGLNSLSTYNVPIISWADMLNACADIWRGDHQYRTVIVDTIDNAWRMCVEHVCKANNVAYEGDLPYGKGYALVTTEFHRVITKLAQLPYGLWMVSHAKTTEVESRTSKYTKMVPTLHDRARNIVIAMSDLILYCSMDEKMVTGQLVQNRIIHTKPNLYYEAGDRTGRLPAELPMDCSAFMACFDPFAGDTPTDMSNIEMSRPSEGMDDDIDALKAILPTPLPNTKTRTTGK